MEDRTMGSNGRRRFLVGCIALAVLITLHPCAHASESFDQQRGELAARMSAQNTFQHDNAQSIDWVQWRNELRFDLRYDLIGFGESYGPLKRLRFNMLWRGRYDAAYDLKDSYRKRDYNRGDFEFPEGRTPRELFFDVGFNGALKDLSLRIGKQQVVWGEADLFRSLDVVNPLDLRQNGPVGEDFSDYRQPLWIFKALYDLGSVASFWNEAGVEAFFSPNSRPQAYQTNVLIGETWKIHVNQSVPDVGQSTPGFTRPMTAPFRQIRHPWEFLRVGSLNGDSPALVQIGGTQESGGGAGGLADFMYRIKNDTSPSEFAVSNMMAGVRLLGTTYGNTYFTINYLFKRSDAASAEVNPIQLGDPSLPGTGAINPTLVARSVNAIFTPDLNGNGIPDGQEEQILNCIESTYPTSSGFSNSLNPFGVVPLSAPKAGEVILDPAAVGVAPPPPPPGQGVWHGSVYSDPKHPERDPGVKAGTFGVPAGANTLQNQHTAYDPVLPLRGLSAVDGKSHASFCQDIPIFHPWTHIIGMSATYNDYDFTGLVFRLEQSFSTKEPAQFSSVSPERLLMQKNNCPLDATGFPQCTGADANVFNAANNTKDYATRAKRYYQVWRSMIGADWTSSIASSYAHKIHNELVRSLLSDQWIVSFQFLNTFYTKFNQIDHSGSFTDRYQQWNPFFTLSGSGYFVHQTFRPTWAFFFDANQMWPGFFIQAGYSLTPKLDVRVGEILYAGSGRAQDNGGLSYYADRDTFFIRLTYFLA
jgi:Protein of unknown function (DUF1302)